MANTLNYGFPKPDIVNNIDEEFYVFRDTTLDMIDAAIKAVADAAASKAALEHSHEISDVTGLAGALADKMPASQTFSLDSLTDVDGANAAAVGQVLWKTADGWVPTSALAALGPHGHLISEVTGLGDALAGKSNTGHGHAISDVTGLQSALDGAVPSGAIMPFARNTAPSGWLKANGAAISRTAYAALFAAIGTTFGSGDGSTTFNLPDLRGEFVRGWDDGRGIDPGRTFGSSQSSQNLSHTHGVTDPGHNHSANSIVSGASIGSGGSYAGGGGTGSAVTGISIQSSGGTEARPRNVAMLFCIKF